MHARVFYGAFSQPVLHLYYRASAALTGRLNLGVCDMHVLAYL
jgi:hypothetical protein